MYDQVKALKEGKSVDKPIYNHVTGVFDPAEKIDPDIPFSRASTPSRTSVSVRCSTSRFTSISPMTLSSPGRFSATWPSVATLSSPSRLLSRRKPDFDEFVDPQKQYADVVIQVLPTQLIPDDNEGKILRVRMIMKEGVENWTPPTFSTRAPPSRGSPAAAS